MPSGKAADRDTDDLVELPELDVDDGEADIADSGGVDLRLPEPDGDGEDDGTLELPFELGLTGTEDEPSALGDDATGIADAPPSLGLALDDRSESLLGSDAEMGCETDQELGIHELPENDDPSDAEGLEDPRGEQVDVQRLPVLESEEDGDDEIDVGIEISAPPAEPNDDDTTGDDPNGEPRR